MNKAKKAILVCLTLAVVMSTLSNIAFAGERTRAPEEFYGSHMIVDERLAMVQPHMAGTAVHSSRGYMVGLWWGGLTFTHVFSDLVSNRVAHPQVRQIRATVTNGNGETTDSGFINNGQNHTTASASRLATWSGGNRSNWNYRP